MYSTQALKNVGAALNRWRVEWSRSADADAGRAMTPCGYVITRRRPFNPLRANLLPDPVPSMYRAFVLNEPLMETPLSADADHHCLGQLKHFPSLMSLALEARKPMFDLKPADGAIGAHTEAVFQCKNDFLGLATALAASVGLPIPATTI